MLRLDEAAAIEGSQLLLAHGAGTTFKGAHCFAEGSYCIFCDCRGAEYGSYSLLLPDP